MLVGANCTRLLIMVGRRRIVRLVEAGWVRAVYKSDKRDNTSVGKLTVRMELSRVMRGTASNGRNSLVTARLNCL